MKKLVVITGASSGIGEATAKKFSAEGHPLLLIARRIDKMESLNLPNTICKQVDVRDKESLYMAMKEAEDVYGEIDCLVNNAGVMLLGKAYMQDEDEWDLMIDVNIKGLLYGIKYVSSKMKERQNGTIINIGSSAGRKTAQTRMVYGATKYAVHTISEILREELAESNVRSVIIAPGIVDTELLLHTTDTTIREGHQKRIKEMVSEPLKTSDIADMIYYVYSLPQRICIRDILIAPTQQIM